MIKYVALDIGGVLAKTDITQLTEYEQILRRAYYCRNNPNQFNEIANTLHITPSLLLNESEMHIKEIFLKSYVLLDDALSSLEYIQSLSCIPALWSNNIGVLNDWLEQEGLLKYIDLAYVCNSFFMPLGSNKPNKQFFINALAQMKAAANEVLYIDDESQNVDAAIGLDIFGLCYEEKKMKLIPTIEKGLEIAKGRM